MSAHELAPSQQVELLIEAAELDVSLDGHRVVGLEHWVQQLMESKRLTALHSVTKCLVRQYPASRQFARLSDDIGQLEFAEPFGLPANFGLLPIENQKRLSL